MSTGRIITGTFAVTFAALLAGAPGDAGAGCLDCLFGRPATYTANYPYTPYGYPAGTVQSGMPPITVSPLNSNVLNSGVVQAQRPAYGTPVYASPALTTVQSFDNPSVYSGLPVTTSALSPQPYATQPYATQYPSQLPTQYSVQRLPVTTQPPITTYPITNYSPPVTTSYGSQPFNTVNRVPIESTLRGNASINPIASAPVNSPYSSYYGSSVAPATYNAPTYGTYNMPLTGSTQTLPLATPPRRTFGSGLSRFFNSLLGRNTNYVTSYYQAPITYYRPMTGIDPATGTTVTVQQPCSSYVQQLQRVPYNSFLPLDAGTTPLLTSPDACSNPMMIGGVSSQTVLPYSSTPGSFAPPSNIVGQVGGEVPLGEYGVSPIPTEFPEAGYPNSAPLTGGSSSDPTLNAPDAADRVPMAPPELKSEKPAADTPDDSATTEAETPRSYFNEFYGDDVYPYGKLNPSYNDNDNADKESGESNPPAGPAIRLDPPVTNIFQNRQQQLTTSTPPPVKSLDNVPHETIQNYSTLRPIGGPADRQDQQLGLSAPLQQPDDDVINAPRTIQPPSTRTFQAPPLPAPSQRGPDPSALFRNTESSASSRSPAPNRVSVPVREATTRHQNVRQVAAWDELPRLPAPRANSSNPVATPSTRPASPVKRDNSDWRPAP